jgi:predicted nucleic acid-binding protein
MNGATRLLVPEFCLVECTNVLWKRVRFENMPQASAEQLARDLHTLPLTLVSVKSLYERALQIGLAHKLAIYDSVYIALAERRRYPLITGDVRQEAAARAVGVTIKPITDF